MPEIIPDDYDYTSFVDCELSETMGEFIDWLHEFVPYKKLDDRSAFLGARLYGYFQRSESHQDKVAERRAAREAEEEPEPAPKRARGKAAAPAEAAPAKPARRGRPAARSAEPEPEPEPEPAPKRPVRRGRGRPVAEGAAAPY
jgi:hypothetical protein